MKCQKYMNVVFIVLLYDLVNYRIDQKIINFSENYKNSKQITSSKSYYSLISMKSRSNTCFFLNQTNNNKLD